MKKKIPLTYALGALPVLGLILPLAILLFTACTNAPAPAQMEQNPARSPCPHSGGRPLPFMWVPKDKGIRQQANFILKDFIFNNGLQGAHPNKKETDSIDYPVRGFKEMIDYFHSMSKVRSVDAWIAVYGDDGSAEVPSGLGNTLTILFAPNDGTAVVPDYFTFRPGGSTGFDPVANKVNKQVAETWITNFETQRINSQLLSTLDPSDPYNYKDSTRPLNPAYLTETRCIHYQMNDMFVFKGEIDSLANQPNNITVTGIRAFFSAFTKAGNDERKYRGRMFVQFELLRKDSNGNDVVFYLDDLDDFCSRPLPGNKFDNGQMCPPTCVPPPPPPPVKH